MKVFAINASQSAVYPRGRTSIGFLTTNVQSGSTSNAYMLTKTTQILP